MPSPFPGMNPYLEQEDVWHDFHERFITTAAEPIAAQVDPNDIVKIDEHVFVHELPASERHFLGRADVAVTRPSRRLKPLDARGNRVMDAPVEAYLPAVNVDRFAFLEIRDRRNRQLVTVIELLSPANKRAGSNRDQYLAKRQQVINSTAHLVEIDLLRDGKRPPIETLPTCHYCIMISRAEMRPRAEVWPLKLRERLPLIPIPLRPPDPDVTLDVQEVLHQVYDRARYQSYVYDGVPEPSLSEDDSDWAGQFLPTPMEKLA